MLIILLLAGAETSLVEVINIGVNGGHIRKLAEAHVLKLGESDSCTNIIVTEG